MSSSGALTLEKKISSKNKQQTKTDNFDTKKHTTTIQYEKMHELRKKYGRPGNK